jgi:radical SAM superfamily enzyme YgiQ (UPF0313 family)
MIKNVTIVGIAGSPNDFLLAPYILRSCAYKDEHIRNNYIINVKNYSINNNADDIWNTVIKTDIICFSCYIWNMNIIEDFISKYGKNFEKIILGGPEISEDEISNYDFKDIICFVIGEGETKFCSLLGSNAQYNYNDLPSPYLSGDIPNELLKSPMRATFETQRGCSFRCAYCLYHRNFPSIKYKDPKIAVSEIIYAYHKGTEVGKIIDANLFSNKEHPKAIFKGLIHNHVKMRLSIDSIPNYIDKELADLCKRYIDQGGEILLGIGLQSLNKESMRSIHRAIDLNKLNKALHLLKDTGVVVRIDTILGLPHETLESYCKLLEYVISLMKLNPKYYLGSYVLKILPGSEMVDIAQKENLIVNDDHSVYATPTMPRHDMVECLKLTSVAFRFFSHENISNDVLPKFFFSKQDNLKISAVELLTLFKHKFEAVLSHSSNFNTEDYPDAENYYLRQLLVDMPANILIK